MNQLFIETETIQDPREGKLQVISNIETCNKISEIMEPTLGPYGMDKLFAGDNLTITNDGATILKKLNVVHPVGKLLVKLSESQDAEIGDGTTSVVIQSVSIMNALKSIIKEGVCMEEVYDMCNELKTKCIAYLNSLKVEYNDALLVNIAETALNSKNIRNEKKQFAEMIVNAYKHTCDGDINLIGINKIPGGAFADSLLVKGIAFEKCFTYAGYEQQPKRIQNPKVLCLDVELEWKAERDNAELNIENVDEYKKVVDAEWRLIKDKLDNIIQTGVNVVLSCKPIGDYATQYFAKNNIFCAGRVCKDDLHRIVNAFGGSISCSTDYLQCSLGSCSLFEERQLGKARYNYFEGENVNACTLILRGPGEETLNEVERSINDAFHVIRTVYKHKEVVTGGGSVEMQISKYLKEICCEYNDRKFFICKAISQSFEKVPQVLAKNFGLDLTVIIPLLRKKHKEENSNIGVGYKGITNMFDAAVFEPLQNKTNIIKTSFEVASCILMIDSTIVFTNNQ